MVFWSQPVIGRAQTMDQFNAGYWQLGLLALLFAGLQVWWIGGTLRRNRQRDLARPMSGGSSSVRWRGFLKTPEPGGEAA